MRDEIELLSAMVAIPSVSGEEAELAAFVEETARSWGLEVVRDDAAVRVSVAESAIGSDDCARLPSRCRPGGKGLDSRSLRADHRRQQTLWSRVGGCQGIGGSDAVGRSRCAGERRGRVGPARSHIRLRRRDQEHDDGVGSLPGRPDRGRRGGRAHQPRHRHRAAWAHDGRSARVGPPAPCGVCNDRRGVHQRDSRARATISFGSVGSSPIDRIPCLAARRRHPPCWKRESAET